MTFVIKSFILIIALFMVGACVLGARIALTTRDHFITLCCGCGAIGILALVIHFIF